MTTTADLRDLDRQFDSNPEAVAWARRRLIGVAARYAGFAKRTHDHRAQDFWLRASNLVQRDLLGDPKSCMIAAFDARLPQFVADEGAPEPEQAG